MRLFPNMTSLASEFALADPDGTVRAAAGHLRGRPGPPGRRGCDHVLKPNARDHKITTLRLDTRRDLVEARQLYARHGYRETTPFSRVLYSGTGSRRTACWVPSKRPAAGHLTSGGRARRAVR